MLHGRKLETALAKVKLIAVHGPWSRIVGFRHVLGAPGGTVPLRTAPWALVTVDGIVSNVLDLTDASILKALATHEQEMTGTWAKADNPPTQELAQAAYDSGKIAGIKYGSAKHPGGVNLAVFPDRLVPPSMDYLEVFDPHGSLAQRIGA
jgi:RES domain-containing protein